MCRYGTGLAGPRSAPADARSFASSERRGDGRAGLKPDNAPGLVASADRAVLADDTFAFHLSVLRLSSAKRSIGVLPGQAAHTVAIASCGTCVA